jgi:hypothetical protein
MKKVFNVLCTCFFLFIFLSLAEAQKVAGKPKQMYTLVEVKEMAKKYNLQDSITSTKRFFLLYFDKNGIEKYLQEESKAIRAKVELLTYLEKTKYVRTFDDDVNLINSLPIIREGIVKSRGGEFQHQLYIRDARKFKWRIYRNEKGALSFERADEPILEHELKWGKRIDNLAKE